METPPSIVELLTSIHPQFCSILQKCDVVVSGSCAVYYAMIENGMKPKFKPSDIDVFITGKNPEAIKFFDDLIKKKDEKQIKKYTLFKSRKTDESLLERVDFGFLENGGKIDVVKISNKFTGTAVDFIMRDFDLDICKCWYDGNKLHAPVDLLRSGRCELTKIDLDSRPQMDPLKLIKYFDEIRKFDPTKPIEEGRIRDPFRTMSRIRKYTERGFVIDTSKLEMPKDIIEQYMTSFLDVLNMHTDRKVNLIFCYEDMEKIDLAKINDCLTKL